MNMTVQEQMRIILQGVSQVVGEEELEKKLESSLHSGKPLQIKFGLDPSAPDIHLGHTVALRKLRQIQQLGHEVIIVIGDFTGKIGDPTGKSKTRVPLSTEQVKENAMTYVNQLFAILLPEKTKVVFNSEWLSKLTFDEVIHLAGSTTVSRMLERDDFKSRFQNNQSIGLHEFLYPLMQAYDSVHLKADIELGGTDQTFNILMGRTLQKHFHMEPQVAIFMPLLVGLDGKEKMSKSLLNYIGIEEDAIVMFQKVMHVPDELILTYFEEVTDIHPDNLEKIRQQLQNGKNPKEVKILLAETITSLYHKEEDVQRAEQYFEVAFTNRQVPDEIPNLLIDWEKDRVIDMIPLMLQSGFVKSASEFRRLVMQGGVTVNGERLEDLDQVLVNDDVIKIGKHKFLRIVK